MARSYKKSPVCTGKSSYGSKRYANKCVRQRRLENLSGASYKKVYCSWNIVEYAFRKDLKEALRDAESSNEGVDKYLNRYYRDYKRK